MQSRLFAELGVVRIDETAAVGGHLKMGKAKIACSAKNLRKIGVQRWLTPGKLDAAAGHGSVQQRFEHLDHHFHLQKVVAAFAIGLGKAYRAFEVAVIGDVDNGQARLVLASHLGAAASCGRWRLSRVELGKDQLVPLFQPAVERRIGEDQIFMGRMAGTL